MSLSYDIFNYESEKLYNLVDVVDKFSEYYGYSINKIEKLLTNSVIVTWDEIEKKLRDDVIGKKQMLDKKQFYNYYQKNLNILRIKGVELINIINYLCNLSNSCEFNDYYENKLEKMEIYHHSSILKGKDINTILIVIFNLLKEFNNNINIINSSYTYLNTGSSVWVVSPYCKKYLPNKELIVFEDEYDKNRNDKTSFLIKRRKK